MDTNSLLPEEHRQRLDGIVQQMTANQEPDTNIQAVVDDYKQKYGGATPPPPQSESGALATMMEPFKRIAGGLWTVAKSVPESAVQLGGIVKGLASGDVEPLKQGGRDIVTGFENLARAGPSIVGAITGGLLGGPGGAYVGGTGGQVLTDLSRKYIGGEDVSPREMGVNAMTAGLASAVPEVAAPVMAPWKGAITQQGKALTEFLGKRGVRPYPGDVRSAPLLDKATGVASKSFGGGPLQRQAATELERVVGPEGYAATQTRNIVGEVPASSADVGQLVKDAIQGKVQAKEAARSAIRSEVESEFGISGEAPIARAERIAKNFQLLKAQNAAESEAVLNTMAGEIKGQAVPVKAFPETLDAMGLDAGKTLGTYSRDPVTGSYSIPADKLQQIRSQYLKLGKYDPKYRAVANSILEDLLEVPAIKEPYDAWRTQHRENVGEVGRAFKGMSKETVFEHFEPMDALRLAGMGGDKGIAAFRILRDQTGGKGPLWDSFQGEMVSRAISDPKFLSRMGSETRDMFFTPDTIAKIRTIHGEPGALEAVASRYGSQDVGRITSTLSTAGPKGQEQLGQLLETIAGTPAEAPLRAELLGRITQDIRRIRNMPPTELRDWRAYIGNVHGQEALQLFDELRGWATTSRAGQRALRSELAPTGVNTPAVGQLGGVAGSAVSAATGSPRAAWTLGTLTLAPNLYSRAVTNQIIGKWLAEGYTMEQAVSMAAKGTRSKIPGVPSITWGQAAPALSQLLYQR